MRPVLLLQILLDLLEIERFHSETGSGVDPSFIPNDVGAQGLREATVRLTELTLEELNNGGREVKLGCLIDDILLGEVVRHHELGEITDHFRRRSHFYDVTALRAVSSLLEPKSTTYELIRIDIPLLDIQPLCPEAQLRSLELEISVLTENRSAKPWWCQSSPSRHLVIEDA